MVGINSGTMEEFWDERVKYFMNLLEGEENWHPEPIESPQGTEKIWRPVAGKLRYKSEWLSKVQPSEVLELLNKPERRVEWDSNCKSTKVLTEDGETRVIYLLTKSSLISSAREEICWATRRAINNAILLIAANCTDEAFKLPGNGVKMTTTVYGFIIYPHDAGSRILNLVDTDPGGFMPASLLKSLCATSAMKNISKIRSLLEND